MNTSFGPDGAATITLDLDMRCLDPDPENARYIHFSELQAYSEAERNAIREEAQNLIEALVEFEFKPGGKLEPDFEISFTAKAGAELDQTQDVLFLQARATMPIPEGANAYRIHAVDRGALTVYFLNEFQGVPVKRFQALFPGETSYWLDLTAGASPNVASGTPAQSHSANPAPPTGADPPSRTRSGWIFVALAVVIAAATALFIIRRSPAQS